MENCEYKLVHKECGSELIVRATTFDIAKETCFRFGVDINKVEHIKGSFENLKLPEKIDFAVL